MKRNIILLWFLCLVSVSNNTLAMTITQWLKNKAIECSFAKLVSNPVNNKLAIISRKIEKFTHNLLGINHPKVLSNSSLKLRVPVKPVAESIAGLAPHAVLIGTALTALFALRALSISHWTITALASLPLANFAQSLIPIRRSAQLSNNSLGANILYNCGMSDTTLRSVSTWTDWNVSLTELLPAINPSSMLISTFVTEPLIKAIVRK